MTGGNCNVRFKGADGEWHPAASLVFDFVRGEKWIVLPGSPGYRVPLA